MENIKKTVNFLFELCGAKTAPRTGWQRIGIKSPESLADHSALSGQIAYVLALMENADPNRAAALALLGGIAKIRTGDENWVSRIYSMEPTRDETVIGGQLSGLPFGENLKLIFDEMKAQKTKEAIVACDANYLDVAIQSKYYADNGNKKALLWIESINDVFQTDSAKEIFAAVKNTGIDDWWMELGPIKKRFEMLKRNN